MNYLKSDDYKPELSLIFFARNELTALKTLTHNLCKSTLTLLNHKKVNKMTLDSSPGGDILYLLMDKLPGVQLTKLLGLTSTLSAR